MAQAYQSSYSIQYNGKDITADISPFVKNINYNSHVDGKSEDLVIDLSDTDGRWKMKWMVSKGATLQVYIGALNCGTFEIDGVSVTGPPDSISIKSIATGFATQWRTKKSKTHAQKTLGQVVQTYADLHGMTIVGKPADLTFQKLTQHKMTDIHFITKIGKKFGHIVSVRKNNLVFTSIYDIQGKDTVAALDKRDISEYTFNDNFDRTYTSATLRYHNPDSGKLLVSTASLSHVQATDSGKLFKPDYIVHNNGIASGMSASGIPFVSLTQNTGVDTYTNEITAGPVLNELAAYNNMTPAAYQAYLEVQAYNNSAQVQDFMKPSPDQLVIKGVRVEDQAQADAAVMSALYHANTDQRTCSITVKGNEYYVAGNNIKLTGFGLYGGMYTITDVAHNITGSGGWTTTLEMKQMVVAVRSLKAKPRALPQSGGKYVDDVTQSRWTTSPNRAL